MVWSGVFTVSQCLPILLNYIHEELSENRFLGNCKEVRVYSLISVIISQNGRRLIISRTFRDEDGAEYVRDEVVKRQDVIDAYVRLSNDMRSKFIDQDEQTREDMRKEKRK